MSRIFCAFLAALVCFTGVTAAYAGTIEVCTWGTVNAGGGFRTPLEACLAEAEFRNRDKPDAQQWKGVVAVMPAVVDPAVPERRECHGVMQVFGPGMQYITDVEKQCEEEEIICTVGKIEKRTFQWLDEKGDDYDIYKAPALINIDNCEFQRQNDAVQIGAVGECRFPAIVEYRATGEERKKPTFDNVPEPACPEDPDDDDDDNEDPPPEDDDPSNDATPGSFPTIRNLYTPKYPGGVKGVLTDLQNKINDTSALEFVRTVFAPVESVGGNCPIAWSVPLDFGPMGEYGQADVMIKCEYITVVKSLAIIGSLFLARAIIFGG